MNRTRLRFVSLGVVTSGLLVACGGKLLSFTSTATSPLADIDAGTSIAQLSDSQANQVCSWLEASFPGPASPALATRDGSIYTTVYGLPGYENGAAFGCPGNPNVTSDDLPALIWVDLVPQAVCVANLREGDCQASLESLEQCIDYFASHYTDFDCADAHAACAAYESAPGCSQTVLQASSQANGDDACGTALPVEAGATCPPYTGPFEGGVEPTYDSGFDSGVDPIYDSGFDPIYDSGFGPIYDSGFGPIYDAGYTPPHDAGLD